MSIRIDRFNLRAAVEPTPIRLAPPAEQPLLAANFKFDLSPLKPTQTRAPAPALASKQEGIAKSLSNQNDVLRLSAALCDVEARLRKSQERTSAVEAQLRLTHSALVAEKASVAIITKTADVAQAAQLDAERTLRLEKAATVSSSRYEAAVKASVATAADLSAAKAKIEAVEAEALEQSNALEALREGNNTLHVAHAQLQLHHAKALRQAAAATDEMHRLQQEVACGACSRRDKPPDTPSAGAPETTSAGELQDQPQKAADIIDNDLSEKTSKDTIEPTMIKVHRQNAAITDIDDDALSIAVTTSKDTTESKQADAGAVAGAVDGAFDSNDPLQLHTAFVAARERIDVLREVGDEASIVAIRSQVALASHIKAKYDSLFQHLTEPATEPVKEPKVMISGAAPPTRVYNSPCAMQRAADSRFGGRATPIGEPPFDASLISMDVGESVAQCAFSEAVLRDLKRHLSIRTGC